MSLQLDMMCNISAQLPNIDKEAVNYHLTDPVFKQIILTGDVIDPLKFLDTSPKEKDYDTKVLREIAKSNSKFLAGCVFKLHPKRPSVTRS